MFAITPPSATQTVTDIEAYNAWVANGSVGQDPFGSVVQTVGTPRLIQFSLRWAF